MMAIEGNYGKQTFSGTWKFLKIVGGYWCLCLYLDWLTIVPCACVGPHHMLKQCLSRLWHIFYHEYITVQGIRGNRITSDQACDNKIKINLLAW